MSINIWRKKMGSKYHSVRTFSALCNRLFASKLEATRAEELRLMEMAGEISDLRYQVRFKLNDKPRITITIDFSYLEDGVRKFEDTKGFLTRDFRTKLSWLKTTQDIEVELIRR